MDDRTQFLIAYAEKKIGRSLSADEASLFEGLVTRREAELLALSLTEKPKAKPKAKVAKKEEDTPIDVAIEEVLNDEV